MEPKESKPDVEAKTENTVLVDRAAHCRIALDCYSPKYQRAALTAIAKMKGEKPSEADIKAVCSDLPKRGPEVLDTLIISLLESLAGLTLEDRVLVTEALIALLPEEERKYAERAERDGLFDKILNDILGDLSNVQLAAILEKVQLEATLKEVMASDDYVKVFILAVTDPEMVNKIHSELLEQEHPDEHDETELPDFAPIEAFLETMTDREKVLFVLCQGLYVSDSNSNNSASKYLTGLWERIDDVCTRDVKGMFDDPDFGNMALTGHLLMAVNRG